MPTGPSGAVLDLDNARPEAHHATREVPSAKLQGRSKKGRAGDLDRSPRTPVFLATQAGPRRNPLPEREATNRSENWKSQELLTNKLIRHWRSSPPGPISLPDKVVSSPLGVATWRRRGTRTCGPYYRLTYRDGGRQHSLYLGRAGTLLNQVRRSLETLQQPLRQNRTINRLRRQVCAALRVHKVRVGTLLRPFGLWLKGFEVRGWRTSPLRRLVSDLRRFRVPRRPQIRLFPKGRASAALRRKKSSMPSSPQARLEAVLAARGHRVS